VRQDATSTVVRSPVIPKLPLLLQEFDVCWPRSTQSSFVAPLNSEAATNRKYPIADFADAIWGNLVYVHRFCLAVFRVKSVCSAVMASESKDDSGFSGTRKEKYDETLDATIPEAETLAASGLLIEAIDMILAVEKRARLVRFALACWLAFRLQYVPYNCRALTAQQQDVLHAKLFSLLTSMEPWTM